MVALSDCPSMESKQNCLHNFAGSVAEPAHSSEAATSSPSADSSLPSLRHDKGYSARPAIDSSPLSGAAGAALPLLPALSRASSCLSTSASRALAVVAFRASFRALVTSARQHSFHFRKANGASGAELQHLPSPQSSSSTPSDQSRYQTTQGLLQCQSVIMASALPS